MSEESRARDNKREDGRRVSARLQRVSSDRFGPLGPLSLLAWLLVTSHHIAASKTRMHEGNSVHPGILGPGSE